MDSVTFPSKVDPWLAAILWLGTALSILALVAIGVAESVSSALLLSPVLFSSAALPVWLLNATDYTLDASELRVRCGPFSWRVPLREIRAVGPTRNPLSSPALSLDRLRIDYGGRSLMVSPEDKDSFLAELRKRAPAIQ